MDEMPLSKLSMEPLRVYFMAIRPVGSAVIPSEKIVGILAYTQEEASRKAMEKFVKFGSGMMITSSGNYELAEDIVKLVEKPKPIEIPEKPVIGIDGFRAGLLMACERFVKGDDKEVLKNIIEKISIDRIEVKS